MEGYLAVHWENKIYKVKRLNKEDNFSIIYQNIEFGKRGKNIILL